MTIHVTPIPRLIDLAVPAFTLGTANAAGSAETAVASDSTLLAFDTTDPAAVAASAVVGSATTAPRRDHVHAGIVGAGTVVDNAVVRFNGTGGASFQGYTSDSPTASDAGVIQTSGQPGFLAYPSATINNVSGNSGLHTVAYDSEIFDQAGVYSPNIFTAPVAGRYLISAMVALSGVTTAANVCNIVIYTSNRTYAVNYGAPQPDADTQYGMNITSICDMDADDEAYIAIRGYGEASDVWDILGGSSAGTFFGAWLLG